MKLIITILLFINLDFWCRAQVFDDFADGNFYENPGWLGNDSLFIINEDEQLQLNALEQMQIPSSDVYTAYLSTPYIREGEMEWRFWIREKFSPSGNNYCDVHLISDNPNLNATNQTYILRFGEAGSEDVIRLLKSNGNGGINNICSGRDTFIASSFSTSIKVTYDNTDLWRIFIDKEGNGFYKLEAEGRDDSEMSFNDTVYFGFKCKFTSSNARQFYFDDIYIGEKVIDSIAPELLNCEVIDDNHIELTFNEAIDEATGLNTDNYIIENLNIRPIEAHYGENNSIIILESRETITEEIYHTLSIENITDIEGNICDKITHIFLYYKAKAYDIVINEIMADPSPPVELPEWEYIELYNTSDYPINLHNWKLTAGNSVYRFDESIEIKPKDYLILCHEDAVNFFLVFNSCKGFISFKVSNFGLDLALFDDNDYLVASVNFDVSWHSESYKEEGGWSLEQIDEDNQCAGRLNWSSSVSGAGGTPGKCNSIKNTNIILPDIDYLFPTTNNSIAIQYNQNMNMESILDIENYLIREMQIHPKNICTLPNKNDYVELIFEQEFDERSLYTLSINNVKNCMDIRQEKEMNETFGLPSQAESKDIVINEILFDPISPGVDYLEIYNRSEKVIDISKLLIGIVKESFPNPADTVLKEICPNGRMLLPHSYILLSSDNDIVIDQYLTEELQESIIRSYIETKELPSFSNTEGRVIVCDKSRAIIDEAYYSEKMHYDLLIETQGVSLERISSENPSHDKNNWHSAAYNVNYGTPGYKNSMTSDITEIYDDNEINVIPEIFSPDGDGIDDICNIHYNLNDNGYSLNLKIFDSEGRLVKNLLNNSLVNKEGFVSWNGCDDNNHHLEPGIYIVQTEIFDLKGFVKRIRKAVVVATKKSP